MTQYRILSFDGGGIRGVFSAQLAKMIHDEVPFLENVDFFAGTSTGSIIALSLAFGLEPAEIIDFYQNKGKDIFQPSPGWESPLSLQPKYSSEQLKKVLQKVFPEDITLADLPKDALCVSFQLFNTSTASWGPALLDNFDKEIAKKIPLVDAIMRSSAAPVYFPSYQGFIDGGVIANNPSMAALSRALDPNGAKQMLSNIRLLSFGTGVNLDSIPRDVQWGALEWVMHQPIENCPTPSSPLLAILMDGIAEFPCYQCRQVLGAQYRRLNANLPKSISLDGWEEVDTLIQIAKRVPEEDPQTWESLLNWVKINFNRNTPESNEKEIFVSVRD